MADLKDSLPSEASIGNFTSQSLNLEAQSQFQSSALTDITKNLHTEIVKEQKVTQINRDANSNLSRELQKLEKKGISFGTALDKVVEYKDSSSSAPARRKRRDTGSTTKKVSIPSFSKTEREALQTFFDSFGKLDDKSRELFKKLGESTKVSGELKTLRDSKLSSYSFKEISSALKRIEWTGDKVLLRKDIVRETTRRGKASRKTEAPSDKNLYGWQSWDTSPWRYFFETEGEWTEKMNSLMRSERALNAYLEKRKILCLAAVFAGKQGVESCTSGRKKFESEMSKIEEEITAHIALQLIKRMQLG